MYELLHYLPPEGRDPFGEWLDELADVKARAANRGAINTPSQR